MLRNYVLALWAAPLADAGVTKVLGDKTNSEIRADMALWIRRLGDLETKAKFTVHDVPAQKGWLLLEVKGRESGSVGVKFLRATDVVGAAKDIVATVIDEKRHKKLDLVVLALCIDESDEKMEIKLAKLLQAARARASEMLVMEPRWVAAILVERLKPILLDDPRRLGDGSAVSYFEAVAASDQPDVELTRTARLLAPVGDEVIDDPGLITTKLREVQHLQPFEGTVLLCTTFLPPVTQSLKAQKRFYEYFGASPEALEAVEDRLETERQQWMTHIAKHRRIDVIDRGQVEEYLAAPEYYQMPLRSTELREQVQNLRALLRESNYELCLAPEAVDLPFEVRGTEVRLRTDRRNKGEPRHGRIRHVILRDPRMVESFEREFWTLYRNTEPEFKDKEHVLAWILERSRRYVQARSEVRKRPAIDVFLCHNSEDKTEVKRIGRRLERVGISVWLDDWNAPPGRQWMWALEPELERIKSAAVFLGPSGVGPWQQFEAGELLNQLVRRGCPIIPVILRSATADPEQPLLFQSLPWIDFRKRTPNPFRRLLWGIDPSRFPNPK